MDKSNTRDKTADILATLICCFIPLHVVACYSIACCWILVFYLANGHGRIFGMGSSSLQLLNGEQLLH